MEDEDAKIESLELWLSKKPYWEQYAWKINLEKDSLSVDDLNNCYLYLSEHLGIIEPLKEKKEKISFKSEALSLPVSSETSTKIKILEI